MKSRTNLLYFENFGKLNRIMSKILSSVFCFLLAIGAAAQPVQGGGYALPLDYPVVYEGSLLARVYREGDA